MWQKLSLSLRIRQFGETKNHLFLSSEVFFNGNPAGVPETNLFNFKKNSGEHTKGFHIVDFLINQIKPWPKKSRNWKPFENLLTRVLLKSIDELSFCT